MIMNYKSVVVFAIAMALGMLIDGVWIATCAKKFYETHLSAFAMNQQLKSIIPAALCFYFLMILGQMVFVHNQSHTLIEQMGWGALYGIIIYGCYGLTCYAVLAQWSMLVVIFDIFSGAVLNGLIAGIIYAAYYFTK